MSDKSDACLVASACAACLAILLCARAASVSTARNVAAHYELTAKQTEWIADGVPLDLAISLDPACDVTVNVAREFPVVVSCPEVP